ncbi:MAG: helix-turn-helix domain-containing protein [Ktedonobacterales bacterium]
MKHDRRANTVLTAEEVAQRWKVNIETVRRWIRSGELQAVDLGGPAGYRIRQAELDRFITRHLTQEEGNTMMEIEGNVAAVTAFFEERG